MKPKKEPFISGDTWAFVFIFISFILAIAAHGYWNMNPEHDLFDFIEAIWGNLLLIVILLTISALLIFRRTKSHARYDVTDKNFYVVVINMGMKAEKRHLLLTKDGVRWFTHAKNGDPLNCIVEIHPIGDTFYA